MWWRYHSLHAPPFDEKSLPLNTVRGKGPITGTAHVRAEQVGSGVEGVGSRAQCGQCSGDLNLERSPQAGTVLFFFLFPYFLDFLPGRKQLGS